MLTALAAFTPLYRKNSGVFPKKFDPGGPTVDENRFVQARKAKNVGWCGFFQQKADCNGRKTLRPVIFECKFVKSTKVKCECPLNWEKFAAVVFAKKQLQQDNSMGIDNTNLPQLEAKWRESFAETSSRIKTVQQTRPTRWSEAFIPSHVRLSPNLLRFRNHHPQP